MRCHTLRRRGTGMRKFTTEARKQGEQLRSGGRVIAPDREFGRVQGQERAGISLTEPARADASASGRTPSLLLAERTASGRSHEIIASPQQHLSTAWRIILATLREIFDENAYDRFLKRTRTSRSVASYRAFMQERESSIVTRPRCC